MKSKVKYKMYQIQIFDKLYMLSILLIKLFCYLSWLHFKTLIFIKVTSYVTLTLLYFLQINCTFYLVWFLVDTFFLLVLLINFSHCPKWLKSGLFAYFYLFVLQRVSMALFFIIFTFCWISFCPYDFKVEFFLVKD